MHKAVAGVYKGLQTGWLVWCGALPALGLGTGLGNVQAQYPGKPICLINPCTAGGPADVFAREIARSMGGIKAD